MTSPQLLERAFGPEQAPGYDARFAALRGIRDALNLLLEAQLSQLPAASRILVVGAGTGAEVRSMAARYPGFQFTLVDPAPAMLAIARDHAVAEGFAERCTFHDGFLDSLPASPPYDAATSVLVSHFLVDATQRRAFFAGIAARLAPRGRFFTADLCPASVTDPAIELWLQVRALAGDVDREAFIGNLSRYVAAHSPAQVEAMLVAAGFESPVHAFQLALIHGWTTIRQPRQEDASPGARGAHQDRCL